MRVGVGPSIVSAVDLNTGEILDRCQLFKKVLNWPETPWELVWADQRPVVSALALFCHTTFGEFRPFSRAAVNDALASLGLAPVDSNVMLTMGKATYDSRFTRPLTAAENDACRVAAYCICKEHKKDLGDELLRRFPLT